MKTEHLSVGQASRLSYQSWRRHLPHYQLEEGYYFVTFATTDRMLLQPAQKDIVFDAIKFLDTKKYDLFAVVVMNDHIHIIINPVEPLSKIMHSIKSFTSHQINKSLKRKGKEEHLAREYGEYKWLYIKGWINDYSEDRRDACPTGRKIEIESCHSEPLTHCHSERMRGISHAHSRQALSFRSGQAP